MSELSWEVGAGPGAAAARRYLGQDPPRDAAKSPAVIRRLDEWAVTRANAVWLTTVGPGNETETLTFGEAAALSRGLARWVRRQLRERPEQVVAVLPSNDRRSVLALLALLRAGIPMFVVDPGEAEGRRAELLGSRPLKAILAPTPETAAQVPGSLLVPDPATLSGDFGGDDTSLPDQATRPAFYFATSGSTAVPKIVAQSAHAAAANAEALRRHHRLGAGTKVLGCLPVSHVNGLHFTLMATLWAGAEAVLCHGFHAVQYRACLEGFRPSIASVVPTILDRLAAGPGPALDTSLRYFVSAAAPLTRRTATAVAQRLGTRVVQGYGLTETTNFSTTMPVDLSEHDHRALTLDCDVPSAGVALAGNEVAVLRSDGSAAKPGETGEVCMRGHNVMLGYCGTDPAEDGFPGGWFRSGDLGHQVEGPRGRRFLVLSGRRKNMAKVLGIAVSFEEMEHRLRLLPEVRDAACFAAPDRFRGEAVTAVLATEAELDRSALDDHLRHWFPAACLPGRYLRSLGIPRSATGKILRPKLVAMFGSGADAAEVR